MTDLEQRLVATFDQLGEEAPADPDLLDSVRQHTGRRWPSPRVVAAAAAVVVGAGAVTAAVAVRGTDTATPAAAGYSCQELVKPTLLPAWARTGFSDPKPQAPYVMGKDGGIVGILFGQPLTSPVAKGRGNKVLWVVQESSGPLRIAARLAAGDEPVVIDSVTGPSYLDLPSPGCWHLDLAWGGHTDSVDIAVSAP
ncbi:MAG: hypothetical protein ABIO16_16930 [Nocardioides sp.]